MPRHLLLLILISLACAQDLDDLTPFPCAADGTCPSGFLCQSTTQTCVRGTDLKRPPEDVRPDVPYAAPDLPPDVPLDQTAGMTEAAPEVKPAVPDAAPDLTATPQPLGSACTRDIECQSGACADGHCCAEVCGSCRKCVAPAWSCVVVSTAEDTDTCSGARFCDAAGTCTPKRIDTQTCKLDIECASGYCKAPGTCTSKRGDGEYCSANADCKSDRCVTFYRDMDGDGIPNRTSASGYCTTPPAGYLPAPPSGAFDCCDRDANAKPGQTAFFPAGTVCDPLSFDFNCDGVNQKQSTIVGSCTTMDGWLRMVPECGQMGMKVVENRPGSCRYPEATQGCR